MGTVLQREHPWEPAIAARVPEEQTGRGEAVLPLPAHEPDSSSEWNVVLERQARPPLVSVYCIAATQGQRSCLPTGGDPVQPPTPTPRLGRLRMCSEGWGGRGGGQ